jgi:maleate isomerase
VLTVGVLTPHTSPGPEVELPGMSAGRVTVVVERIAPDDADAPERAAARFADGSVGAVAYASTTSGYALGHEAETALVERLGRICGVPVVASASSAVAALRTYDARRLTLVHPPWFDEEIDEQGARYFRDQGFDVAVVTASGVPEDPSRVRPEDVADHVGQLVGDEAEAVFVAGTGFRAAVAIEALELRTGRPVLEANQVMLWSILEATRPGWAVTGFGRLFGGTG